MKAAPKTRPAGTAPAPKKKRTAAKVQRSVWTGVKRKGGVSPFQLHLPGLGGMIQ